MCLTNRSGDAFLEIVKMAVETLQHMTTLTVSPCLLIYCVQADGTTICFRPGKPEADGSVEV